MDPDALAAQYERELRSLRNERRIETLMDQGKVLPWAKEGMIAFMAELDDSSMIAFADGEEQTQTQWFLDYLEKQPAVVTFGAVVGGDETELSASTVFAAPEGQNVDRDGLRTHARVTKIMHDKGVKFEDALDMIHGD